MANAIFEDLEIDFSDMLSNPEGFAERVYAAADKLKEICKADISVDAFTKRYKDNAKPIPPMLQEIFNEIYEDVDNIELDYMVEAIVAAKKLVADLETAFRDRCIRQAAKDGTAIGDKRLAHAQYTRLKDDFNLYVKSIGMFSFGKELDLRQLPNLPGNYGSGTSSFIHYVFEMNGEQYRNHHLVCRKLGIDTRPLSDLLEYLEQNDTGVVVKEIQ
jgi:hypothetical protein